MKNIIIVIAVLFLTLFAVSRISDNFLQTHTRTTTPLRTPAPAISSLEIDDFSAVDLPQPENVFYRRWLVENGTLSDALSYDSTGWEHLKAVDMAGLTSWWDATRRRILRAHFQDCFGSW